MEQNSVGKRRCWTKSTKISLGQLLQMLQAVCCELWVFQAKEGSPVSDMINRKQKYLRATLEMIPIYIFIYISLVKSSVVTLT
jgi:hypothetical protein